MNDVQIPIDSDDASWKERCSKKMKELESRQFPSQDAASQPKLPHKELVGEKNVLIPELFKAVENGNVDNFVHMLEQECTKRKLPLSGIFNQVTGAGDSLLHVAAALGKDHIADLISHHFPQLLNSSNLSGDTPLHVAVKFENFTMVKLILSQYALLKSTHEVMTDKVITRKTNKYGNTPLHEALYGGDVGVIEEIFRTDNDVVHYLNKSKRSPLYLGVVNGNVKILNLLLEVPLPADQPLPLCLGNSPLHAAILERKKPALIKEILARRPESVYLRDEHGNTSLHCAAKFGYVEGFRILLENSLEKMDQTALEGNKKGHLPIHLACKKGHVKIVTEFLRHEWSINLHLLNQKGQNILHIAAKNGKSKLVQYLLGNPKIDQFTINQKDNLGNTPLHLASKKLFPKVLYLFTGDKRTNVKLSNNKGLTPMDIVYLAWYIWWTRRKHLAFIILWNAGVPTKIPHMLDLDFRHAEGPKKELMNLKDIINAFLVAATLIVTVTFAAAFTVPGGVYSSDDPNPKNRGMAVLVDKPFFWVFATFNMTAMYSSVLACGLMLLAIVERDRLGLRVTAIASLFLIVAFLSLPMAFISALRLIVANNNALALVLTLIGLPYTIFILMLVILFFWPFGLFDHPLYRQAGRPIFRIIIEAVKYNDKPGEEEWDKDKDDKDKNKTNQLEKYISEESNSFH